MVVSTLNLSEPNTSYKAVNKDRALKITETTPTAALSKYRLSLPVQIDLEIPSTLKRIEVVWATDNYSGDGSSDAAAILPSNSKGMSVEIKAENKSQGSYSLIPSIRVEMQHYWGRDVEATVHFFYCDATSGVLTEAALRGRLSTLLGTSVQKWPKFKPESHTLVAQGGSLTVTSQAEISKSKAYDMDGISASSESSSSNKGSGFNMHIDVVNIPVCLHEAINIVGADVRTLTASSVSNARITGELSGSQSSSASSSVKTMVSPASLPATEPASVPRSGLYLISSKVEPYKWGWVKCSAVVFDAGNL